MQKLAVGVDIGGSHITSALVDLNTGRRLSKSVARHSVNSKAKSKTIIDQWVACIEESMGGLDAFIFDGIGIAMPGPFDYEAGISQIKGQGKYDGLFNRNVKELIAKRLKINSEDVRFINDAAAFLQGEVVAGAAEDAQSAIGITLGTGLGSAFYFDGISEDAKLWCSPFREGIAEDSLSTRWFVSRYKELSGNKVEGVKEIANRIEDDAASLAVFDEFGKALAEFLIPLLKKKRPEYLVIGGNIAKSWELFIKPVKSAMSKERIKTKLVPAELSEEAAVIGSAVMFNEELMMMI